jgi:pimeloyl-ACP methyl ester carboxylesterase
MGDLPTCIMLARPLESRAIQMSESYERPPRDLGALAEITDLFRRIAALRTRSPEERRRLFDLLEVSSEQQTQVAALIDRFKDIIVLEPGLVLEDPVRCPIGWQPSGLAPVFYGTVELGTTEGLPGRVRIFYPSVDGSPENAAMLTDCGRYPLVLFLHGDCSEADHFRAWELLPAQLARSGYVVAVPEHAARDPWDEPNTDVQLAEQVLVWMRSTWDNAASLLPPPITAVVGHSWGALLAGLVARRLQGQGAVSAYVSIGGGWLEWPPDVSRPLSALDLPVMFLWGTGYSDLFAKLDGENVGPWLEPRGATHKVVFTDGEHWDYLPEGATTCGSWRGSCPLVASLATDLLTMFLSHYLPPEKWWLLKTTIPHSLLPPPFELSTQQKSFAGGHLFGFDQIDSAKGCVVTHTWRLPPAGGGSITLAGP